MIVWGAFVCLFAYSAFCLFKPDIICIISGAQQCSPFKHYDASCYHGRSLTDRLTSSVGQKATGKTATERVHHTFKKSTVLLSFVQDAQNPINSLASHTSY